MPKDNEVDEKVMPVAWIVTNGGESCEPWLEYEQSEVDALPAVCIAEPLYSAATVAELRAEVERLRAALHIETHRVITCGVAASHPDASLSRRMEYAGKWDSPQAQDVRKLRDRADAAERRVWELTSLLSDTVGNLRRMANDEFADCDQVRLEHVVNRIEQILTGADPT